jgi:DNA repair photolyase
MRIFNIKRVSKPVKVYDLQTATENFFCEGVLVHNCFTEAVLTEPYGGYCAVGCQFCYINSGMRGYRGTGLISVPLNYGDQIRAQLSKMRRAAAGYFSSFTDPFTPLEDFYHNTQRAAEEFVKVGLPLFFLSRLPYPDWAVDLLTKNPHSYAQKSINTCDPTDWRHLSPGAMALEGHLEEITKLKRRGIYVSIQVNPIVPGVTSNEQVLRLFRMLKDAGADHVIVKFVEAAYSWAPAMVKRMIKVFGDRGRDFERLFTCNIGAERTVDEAYRLRAHRLYSTAARRLGLTYATCYEYEYERDAAGKILSKVGKSIGRKFTTAAQCHGHAVPVYARASADEPFRPLDECPPSGCLHCADENEEAPGTPRCGDELAGGAYALQLKDLKTPMGAGKKRTYELPLV